MFFGCFLTYPNPLHPKSQFIFCPFSWSTLRIEKPNCRVTTLDCKHFVSNSKDAKVLDMVTTLKARASFPMRRMRNKTSSTQPQSDRDDTSNQSYDYYDWSMKCLTLRTRIPNRYRHKVLLHRVLHIQH